MKSKQFIAGLIIGATVASGVGVYAAGTMIEATKTDDTTIYVDGEKLELEDGFYILNYEGRTYTSVRAVAESLGADVGYTSDNSGKYIRLTSKEDVIIPTPTPIPTVEPTPTPSVEPTPTPTPTPAIDYRLPPVRSVGLGISAFVYSAEVPIDMTQVKVDFTNNNADGVSMVDYQNIKLIDEKGKEYPVYTRDNSLLYNSLPNKSDIARQTLEFEKLKDGTKVILSIPVTKTDFSDGNTEKYDIRIPIIIEDYDSTTVN